MINGMNVLLFHGCDYRVFELSQLKEENYDFIYRDFTGESTFVSGVSLAEIGETISYARGNNPEKELFVSSVRVNRKKDIFNERGVY